MKVIYREHQEYKWHELVDTTGFFERHIANLRRDFSLTVMEIAQHLRMVGSYPYGEVTFDIKIEREESPDCHYTVITDIDAAAVTKFVSTEIISLPEH